MTTKIWSVDTVKNHLLAIRTAIRSGPAPPKTNASDSRRAAYQKGGETALKFLAERFGISLNGVEPTRLTHTGELRLSTWTRDDIKAILEQTCQVLHQKNILYQPDPLTVAYYQGIDKTIFAVALSFGITDLATC